VLFYVISCRCHRAARDHYRQPGATDDGASSFAPSSLSSDGDAQPSEGSQAINWSRCTPPWGLLRAPPLDIAPAWLGRGWRHWGHLLQEKNLDAFVDRALDGGLQGRIPQKLLGGIEFGVELPVGAGNRIWQFCLVDRVGYPAGSAAAAQPLNVALQLRHLVFAFNPISASANGVSSPGQAPV
jgi:hypothetical protein